MKTLGDYANIAGRTADEGKAIIDKEAKKTCKLYEAGIITLRELAEKLQKLVIEQEFWNGVDTAFLIAVKRREENG